MTYDFHGGILPFHHDLTNKMVVSQEKDPERQRSWSNLAGCEGTTSQWDAPRHQRGEDVCGLREEPQWRGRVLWSTTCLAGPKGSVAA